MSRPASINTSGKHRYTSAELRDALNTMAQVIVRYGDGYLPIYERVERELDAALKRELTLERVKKTAENAQHSRNICATNAARVFETVRLTS